MIEGGTLDLIEAGGGGHDATSLHTRHLHLSPCSQAWPVSDTRLLSGDGGWGLWKRCRPLLNLDY